MMNSAKLCGLVVMLCVICPVMVGFVWPVAATTETGYETGAPINISNDAINDSISVFVPYNDPYNNNRNVFDATYYDFANIPVTETSNVSPVWTANKYSYYEEVTTDADGFYDISDIRTWQNWAGLGAKVVTILKGNDWDEIDFTGGYVADLVVYYPETETLFFRAYGWNGPNYFFPAEVGDYGFTFSGTPGTYRIYYDTYTVDSYADLNDGFYVPGDAYWFNGYENKAANIIFSTTASNSRVDLTLEGHSYPYDETTISIQVIGGSIYLDVYENSVLEYSDYVGDNDVYSKVLLNIDYDSKKISLSALRNLNSYIGDYQVAIRNTISYDWQHPTTFYSFEIDGVSGTTYWYVPDTISGVSSTPGSHNVSLNMRDYSNDSLQINLRSVQLHSDKFNIQVNSTTYYGTIEGNTLTMGSGDGFITVPINNLLIGLIDNKVYLNGQILADPGVPITTARLIFSGDWLMSLYLYHMIPIDIQEYEWMAGGFGLDVSGFCSVGLITSFGSALLLGLYGRRSGVKLAAVTITATICGSIYMILLMGGL